MKSQLPSQLVSSVFADVNMAVKQSVALALLLIKDICPFLITFSRPESNCLTETLFQKSTFKFSSDKSSNGKL